MAASFEYGLSDGVRRTLGPNMIHFDIDQRGLLVALENWAKKNVAVVKTSRSVTVKPKSQYMRYHEYGTRAVPRRPLIPR